MVNLFSLLARRAPIATVQRHFYFNSCPLIFRGIFCSAFKKCESQDLSDEVTDALLEGDFLFPRHLYFKDVPHKVCVIQPYIKWGPKKKRITTPQLQLDEAIALINTLPGWEVMSHKIISLMDFDKKSFFNKGQLVDLKEMVITQRHLTGIFLNVQTLSRPQQVFLEHHFGLPVFDRYSVIVNIFKLHAHTKEAKLQVAMAEIPFMYTRIKSAISSDSPPDTHCGDMAPEKRLKLLGEREQKIKRAIQKLRKSRELLRNRRRTLEFPIVAVVGYTNAGKTSLIKCLTDEETLIGENKLFATLDVTLHAGLLPSNLKVLYVDTIGFISDIPTTLIEPFVATLEDALMADVILHVEDISHPDRESQHNHVLSTLKSINLDPSLMENIIHVGNKADKLTNLENNFDKLLISCKLNHGIEELQYLIERAVLKATGLSRMKIRVRSGGTEYEWLNRNVTVSDVEVDPKDPQFIFLNVLISKAKLGKFKHMFITQS